MTESAGGYARRSIFAIVQFKIAASELREIGNADVPASP
jgi:hypothetical protein